MPRHTRSALATAALLAVAALAGATPAGAQHTVAPEVVATVAKFTPADLEIHPGTEVTWKVEGDGTHNITLEDPKADCSGDSDCSKKNVSPYFGSTSEPFVRKFEKLGEYRYFCIVHKDQGMAGVIRVTSADTAPSTTAPPTTTTTVAPTTTAPPPPPPPSTTATTRPPAPAPTTTTTKPSKAAAAGKTPKPPKPTTSTDPTTTTVPPTTTTTTPPPPPLGALPPLVAAPAETTTTTSPAPKSGEEGFVAINKGTSRRDAKKMALAAVGGLGATLLAGGFVWWRRRPSRYWSA